MSRQIDGYLRIRNLLTMLRKAIHLDGREERASIDPSLTKAGQWTTATKFSRASDVVSGPRLLKREPPQPHAIRAAILRSCDGAIIYITSELVNKRRDVCSDAEACRNRLSFRAQPFPPFAIIINPFSGVCVICGRSPIVHRNIKRAEFDVINY